MRIPHRSGSKPHRDLIYGMGGKDGNPPDSSKVFFATRQKNGNLVDQEAMNKYDEIMKVKESNTSFDDIELIEKCFGSQSHSHVFCYGGGIKRKHLVESNSSYVKKLEARLLEKEEENGVLQKRIDGIENRLEQIEKDNSQPSMASTRSNDDLHQVHHS
ncbi:uncharacterized protein LOC126653630 [Mercurialis annua]|uniref:uncharacterized protein LOC126653630 n=1 Tax=Mercurialis annua TaxID=3986 RepID=UPI00215F55A7|nr:uncharacterized protein LOC126653630 [Mercurialis annua]